VVIEDACAGVTKELHEAALKVMRSCQARITALSELIKTTEDARAQLTETNPSPDAKSL
jgi:nicotinamidase-related amidase